MQRMHTRRAGQNVACVPGKRAGGNLRGRSATNHSRRGLFLSYNARHDGGEQREAHYRRFHDYLRRMAPARGQDPAMLYFR